MIELTKTDMLGAESKKIIINLLEIASMYEEETSLSLLNQRHSPDSERSFTTHILLRNGESYRVLERYDTLKNIVNPIVP